jgi:hypothetical protein
VPLEAVKSFLSRPPQQWGVIAPKLTRDKSSLNQNPSFPQHANNLPNKNLGLRARYALFYGIVRCLVRRKDYELPKDCYLIGGVSEQQ